MCLSETYSRIRIGCFLSEAFQILCGLKQGEVLSLLLTSYKILSNIILGRLTPYVDEIIGDHECGFRRNIVY